MYTRKILMLLVGIVMTITCKGQNVSVEIYSGIDNSSVKSAIEKNASALLTEINRANRAGSHSLDLNNISMTNNAQRSIAMLWENTPFYCEDRKVAERITRTYEGGYQMRNIPLALTPAIVSPDDDLYQEAVIDFDRYGKIESFYFAIGNNQYANIVNEGERLGDSYRRLRIVDCVEQFRTAYNQKDLPFLRQVFSDDALIITGKVIKTTPTEFNRVPQKKVIAVTKSKEKYLKDLANAFNRNNLINVQFSEIEIFRHPTKPDYYGVSLRQKYQSDTYGDDGYLFLLWDFTDEDHPQIHVRVWEHKDEFLGKNKFSIHDVRM